MITTISILAGLAAFALVCAAIVIMSKPTEPPVQRYSDRESPSTTRANWTTPTQKNEEWLKRSLEKAKSNKTTRSNTVRRDKDFDLDLDLNDNSDNSTDSNNSWGSYVPSHDHHRSP